MVRHDYDEERVIFNKTLVRRKAEAYPPEAHRGDTGDHYMEKRAHATMLRHWIATVDHKDGHDQRDRWELAWLRNELEQAEYVGD